MCSELVMSLFYGFIRGRIISSLQLIEVGLLSDIRVAK